VTKEILTKENVKQDLLNRLKVKQLVKYDWRFLYILFAAALGCPFLALRLAWVSVPFFAFAGYHVVRVIMEAHQNHTAKKLLRRAIDRGDFFVSVQELDHIGCETVYEPNLRVHWEVVNRHCMRAAEFFYFSSGAKWRMPKIEYYSWNKNAHMSKTGLKNTSLPGNEFYLIALPEDHEISFVYNTKMFQLGDEFSEPA